MPDDYDYVGQPLTTRMAKQLIENDFPPRHITVDDLRKEVEKLHIGRGRTAIYPKIAASC